MTKSTVLFLFLVGISLAGCSSRSHPANEGVAIDVEAGPIWDNDHARKRCPELLAEWLKANPDKDAVWTGNWTTTIRGEMSVCNFRVRNK